MRAAESGIPTLSGSAATDRVLLVFQCASCWFGVDPRFTQELAIAQRPTPVPRTPDYIPGLIPLRGRAVPVLDLQKFLLLDPATPLGQNSQDEDLLRRMVVVTAGGMTVALLSERVRSLFSVPQDSFLPAESLPQGRVREFAEAGVADPTGIITGPGGIIVVLRVGALLEAARLRPGTSA